MSDQSEFPKRLSKKLPTGFEESVESMDTEEIKKKIYESQCHQHEIERAKEADPHLASAREEVKNLSGPYKDAMSTESAKIKFCFHVLEGRGVSITPKS